MTRNGCYLGETRIPGEAGLGYYRGAKDDRGGSMIYQEGAKKYAEKGRSRTKSLKSKRSLNSIGGKD